MNAALTVLFNKVRVGRLALDDRGRIFFQYDGSWLASGFDLSPGTLPFDGLAHESIRPGEFQGLHGVFNDSLPDGWGLLLMDRVLKQRFDLDPQQVTPLDRLSYMGTRGMGGLEYSPETLPGATDESVDLADLARESGLLLNDKTKAVLERLRIYGGSPGGARPKVTLAISADGKECQSGFKDLPQGYTHWMVKFRGKADPKDIGRAEKAYADMADAAGIVMPKTALVEVPANKTREHYFAVQRFDREGNQKRHFLSLSGYIYANHRVPCISYSPHVIGATRKITGSAIEAEKAFRLMLFNVLAHNKDDHAKNFAFIWESCEWKLSPAFDLTFSGGINNNHTTDINGSGNPTLIDIRKVAEASFIRNWETIVKEVRAAVTRWPEFASKWLVTETTTRKIQKALREIDRRTNKEPRISA